ncbi:hypothetical protein [Neisseria iguanae]|nr:hypothetical protein [Neisseria iguanae]
MAVAETITSTVKQRLDQALEQENPRPLLLSGLERDAKSLFGTPDASFGYLILGILDAINNRKNNFDKHFDFISAPEVLNNASFYRLIGLNRMGYFDDAIVYLEEMFKASRNTNDPLLLRALAQLGMLYGFMEQPGLIIERLNMMTSHNPNQNVGLIRLLQLLKNTKIKEAVLVSVILAGKELLKEKGFQIPTYAFHYSVELDNVIELRMLCFCNNLAKLVEADEALSALLIDMEDSVDSNLINFNISCRPFNSSHGIGC